MSSSESTISSPSVARGAPAPEPRAARERRAPSGPPRVFIVHEPLKKEVDPITRQVDWVRTRDVSIAREFGELHYVFPSGRLSQDPEYLVKTARAKLREFTANDYLLPMGDTAAIVISSIVASQVLEDDENRLKILLWDNRVRRYYPLHPEVWEPDQSLEASRA